MEIKKDIIARMHVPMITSILLVKQASVGSSETNSTVSIIKNKPIGNKLFVRTS